MTYSIQRLPTVSERTGLSRSTIYRYLDEGIFPKPMQIGHRAVGWKSSDIDDWLNSRHNTSFVNEV